MLKKEKEGESDAAEMFLCSSVDGKVPVSRTI